MSDENDSKSMKDKGNSGAYIGGNFVQKNISGQNAVGSNITQTYIQSSSTVDIEKLKKSLIDFREELVKMDISSDDKETIKNDVSAALIEAGKEEPKLQKIQSRVENVIETLKETGKTVKTLTEMYGSLKIAAGMLGIPL